MTATALARKGPKYDVPPASVDDDATFFATNPATYYRIRPATAAEVKTILARGPVEAEGCQFVALIHQSQDGNRRRLLVEAYGVDVGAFHDGELAELFDNVVKNGWTWFGEIS